MKLERLFSQAALVYSISALIVTGEARAQQNDTATYQQATSGTRWLGTADRRFIKVLVESTNLGGGEVDIAEITFAAGSRGRGHLHNSIEIFYILSGEFEHTVNGTSHVLTPGMVGIVRPGDEVVHTVLSDEPVKALVIWAPGGEAARIARSLREYPIDD